MTTSQPDPAPEDASDDGVTESAGPDAAAPASAEVPLVAADGPAHSEDVEPEPAVEPPVKTPGRRRVASTFAIAGLAVIAFIMGLVVFNNVIMPRLVHSVNEMRIPDLTNLTLEQAEQTLRARNLQLSRAGERFDPSVPRGFILSQDPPAETPIRGRKRVSVTVSLGEEFSSVPELFGESNRTARYLLERAGLRVGGITRAPSEDVGDGLVASTDPPAESVLPRDTPVSLLISTGGTEESYVMPDVLGHEIGGAKRQLESLGFRVFTPPAAPSVGTVVYQEPPPGSRISRVTTILLQATGRIIR
jgi:beta-lactam-binding protein with PASTA domain